MIVRTYGCNDCGCEFEVTCESSAGDPDCPNCTKVLEWRPKSFAITGIKSKALDVTQRIMEQQYGFTNFKDKVDQGETVVMPAAEPQTAKKDQIIQEVAQYAQQAKGVTLDPRQAEMAAGFWGQHNAPLIPQLSAADMLAGARAATADANAHGANPMKMLHDMGRSGHLKTPIQVVARAKM